ncbi:MAG: rod shape-determining protein MreD [Bacillota bacterium]
MTLLVWLAVLIISLTLQSTLLDHPMLVAKPDLLLVFIVLWGLLRGSREAAQLGFFFGLFEDLFVGKYIGLNLLSKASIGYIAGWGEKRFYKENLLLPVVGLLLGTPLFQCIYYLFGSLGGLPIDPLIFARDTLIKSGYHSLIGILIYPSLLPRADGVRLKVHPNRLRRK